MSRIITLEDVRKYTNSEAFIKKYIYKKSNLKNYDSFFVDVFDLGHGEYNYNFKLEIQFLFCDNKEKIIEYSVFRINYGSQMHLQKQIEYEFNALLLLEKTGVTPKPVFCDDSCTFFPREYLVMDYIEGETFSYNYDMNKAALCLSKIHSLKFENYLSLIKPDNPFDSIIEECRTMYKKYEESKYFDIKKDIHIQQLFHKVKSIRDNSLTAKNEKKLSLINTELNSSNFIVNLEECYLIDWEKPIIGESEQDIGHFLAPTTTFWKTDKILNKQEIRAFLKKYYELATTGETAYMKKSYTDFENKVNEYIVCNCLRGLTWCAMAWVEYNDSEKDLVNEFTYNKLNDYLDLSFIEFVVNNYVNL
ncbi:phosphotransferase [Peptostreptococcus faecalis]|uniref:phosphotransferase n=1 Tax=Peptostreptococcus faecalis TaxID=2045015 RepID=UPI000C7C534B|nr:phosphotransferase [Peptostreptococcus faecalis]